MPRADWRGASCVIQGRSYSSPVLGGLRARPAGLWPSCLGGWPPVLVALSLAFAARFGRSGWHPGHRIGSFPASWQGGARRLALWEEPQGSAERVGWSLQPEGPRRLISLSGSPDDTWFISPQFVSPYPAWHLT